MQLMEIFGFGLGLIMGGRTLAQSVPKVQLVLKEQLVLLEIKVQLVDTCESATPSRTLMPWMLGWLKMSTL